MEQIGDFCRRWQITEFPLFGSVLRDGFQPDSDIDALVTFALDARRALWDLIGMQDELKERFGRDVDLVERSGIERSDNYLRRKAILSTVRVIYES